MNQLKSPNELALFGGHPVVQTPHPHQPWPPQALPDELAALAAQRNNDLCITGRTGPILELEESWKEFLENKVKYAVTYNSGTSALLAAYFAAGIGEGDEVIGPAITYHAAMSCLYFLKATPILVDVNPATWTLDPALIEASITPHTRAITVVHQWGHPADMKRICAIARTHQLILIEDCSHAHGSMYHGQPVGTLGDIAVFSLQTNKIIFAGEGGIMVTNSDEYHDRATLFGHYRDRARDEIIDPFYQQFWVTGYGLKLRISPYAAITALHALHHFPERMEQRHRCLHYLSECLHDLPELLVPTIEEGCGMGAWYGYKPRYLSERLCNIPRDEYVAAVVAEGVEVGIPSSPAFSTLPLFTIKNDRMFRKQYQKRTYHPGQFPIAEMLAEQSLSLPTFTQWPEQKSLIDAYSDAFHKVHRAAHHSTWLANEKRGTQ